MIEITDEARCALEKEGNAITLYMKSTKACSG